MRIAFIGLGNMGGGMAPNLVKAGHAVRAFDLSEAALAHAREGGCETFRFGRGGDRRRRGGGLDAAERRDREGCLHEARDRPRPQGCDPDRLLDDRRRDRARGRKACRRCRVRDGRCPGLGRHRRRGGGDADVHGRRQRCGVQASRSHTHEHGQGGDPRGRSGRGPGGQDLQQHDARHPHDRDLRGLRDGPEASGSTRRCSTTSPRSARASHGR